MKGKMRIALFPNKNKNAENHPDYNGNVEVDGKKFAVAAWTRDMKGGGKYLSGEIDFDKEVVKKSGDTIPPNTL